MKDQPDANKIDLEEGLDEASRLVDDGELEAAMQVLIGLEPQWPDDTTLLCMIGVVAGHLGGEGMATDFFRRCLALEPTDPEILVRAGSWLASVGDTGAEPALRQAVLTAPDFGPGRLYYGSLLLRNGLIDQGLEELRAARELLHNAPEVSREIGIGFLLAGQPARAVEELEAAAEGDDAGADNRYLLGLVLLQMGDHAQAAEVLHPCAAEMPEDAEAQLLLALAFAAVGWEDEAWLAVSRAESAMEPADPALLQDVEEALEEGEEAVRTLLVEEFAPTALRERIYRIGA